MGDLTLDQVAVGFDMLLNVPDRFPPSISEFRRLCLMLPTIEQCVHGDDQLDPDIYADIDSFSRNQMSFAEDRRFRKGRYEFAYRQAVMRLTIKAVQTFEEK